MHAAASWRPAGTPGCRSPRCRSLPAPASLRFFSLASLSTNDAAVEDARPLYALLAVHKKVDIGEAPGGYF